MNNYAQDMLSEKKNFVGYYAYCVLAIFQYGIIVWNGNYDNVINIQQNKIVRICLDKNTLDGTNTINYKQFGLLPVNLLYKKLGIMFISKK